VELLGVVPLAQLEIDRGGLDDLDARGSHTVTRCHLSVHLLHCTIQSGVTVLLVHVVVAGPALVAQPDAIVLDRGWVTLKDLKQEPFVSYTTQGNYYTTFAIFVNICNAQQLIPRSFLY
jgi:hypothetical protein